jgi:hypothetical protein
MLGDIKMRLEDGIVYWDGRGRYKCGDTTNVSSIAVVKASLYTFGFTTRGFDQVKNSGGFACR